MAYSRTELIELLRQYARRYDIDEAIAIAQIQQESSFNPRASSGKANGIAQFTPATAQRFGVNVWDVESSFDGWGRYMRWLLDRYNGDYSLALAGYNAGEGRVDRYGGIPPFAETKNYVSVILRNAGATAVSAAGAIAVGAWADFNVGFPDASAWPVTSEYTYNADPSYVASSIAWSGLSDKEVLIAVVALSFVLFVVLIAD